MNGRLNLDYFSLGPGRAWARLAVALAVSALAHGALVLIPGFGTGSPEPGAAPALEVRVVPVEPSPAPAPATKAAEPPAKAARPAPPKATPQAPARVPGIGVLPIPAHHFHTADQLTKRARPLARPDFDVPRIAPAFATGSVVLKVWIDSLGGVVAVEIESSEVPEALAMNAAKAFAELRYSPGEIAGRKVASMMRVEVAYLDGRQVVKVIGGPR